MKTIILTIGLLFLCACSSPRGAFTPVEDVPGLPRVLLIGDSISEGYTVSVQNRLSGIANVHRAPVNCASTAYGLEHLDEWLGSKPWNVIHFNWGLHDLLYVDEQGNRVDDPKSPIAHQQVSLEQYESNLEKLVARLEKTGATLIWCETTLIPQGSVGRIPGDEARYNEVAAKVMQSHGIRSYSLSTRPDIAANVHYTESGSDKLGEQVAKVIREALKK